MIVAKCNTLCLEPENVRRADFFWYVFVTFPGGWGQTDKYLGVTQGDSWALARHQHRRP